MQTTGRAKSAVQKLRGAIHRAFDKLLKNEAEYERAKGGVEGEGSYEGTRRYNADVEEFVSKGRTGELANEANQALNGPEGKALRDAENAGKKGPQIPRPTPRKPATNGRR